MDDAGSVELAVLGGEQTDAADDFVEVLPADVLLKVEEVILSLEGSAQLHDKRKSHGAEYLLLLIDKLLHLILLQQGLAQRLYRVNILQRIPHQVNPSELPVCQFVYVHEVLQHEVAGLLLEGVLKMRDHLFLVLLHLLYDLLERNASD